MNAWEERLAALPAVALAQVDAVASLQTRVDRKYIVPAQAWADVVGAVPGLRCLEIDGSRVFGYASLYYDTPELSAYRAAARRRPSRYKVRTREYVDSGARAVEVKLRAASGATVKHRMGIGTQDAPDALAAPVRAFLSSFAQVAPDVDALVPQLETRYDRATLVGDGARITIDRDVVGIGTRGAIASFGDVLIVETKTTGRACAVDRSLWARGFRPSRVSKYCTSLAALHPDLPHHPWSRTLRRHVITAAPTAA